VSNANTPEMMAQAMAESLLRENKALRAEVASLKEQHNSLLNVCRQNMQLVSELQEQNAPACGTGAGATSRMEHMRSATQMFLDAITYDKDGYISGTDSWKLDRAEKFARSAVAEPLTALPQQVKSEDARDGFQRFDVENLMDFVSAAIRKAWSLGQIYWQQADSEYLSQQSKSDETHAKFKALVEETRSAIAAISAQEEKA
jgi:hypothetical protein